MPLRIAAIFAATIDQDELHLMAIEERDHAVADTHNYNQTPHCADFVRTASLPRADMIFGNDNIALARSRHRVYTQFCAQQFSLWAPENPIQPDSQVREIQRIITFDAGDPPLACNVCRRPVEVATSTRSCVPRWCGLPIASASSAAPRTSRQP